MAAIATRCRTKTVAALTDGQFRTLSGLTLRAFGQYGSMLGKFETLRDCGGQHAYATWIRDHKNGQIVAWALTFRPFYPSRHYEYETYFFVHPAHRRRGYGTRLYRNVRRQFGIVKVNRWDDTSTSFFNRVEGT